MYNIYTIQILSKALNTKNIKAGFQVTILDRIVGESTYTFIHYLEAQLIRNATTIKIRLTNSHTNLSSLVESVLVYILHMREVFSCPVYPGDNPIHPARAVAAQNSIIQEEWQHQKN